VTVDGEDLRSFTRDAWRERVGLVLQEVYLFPGTLRENLTVFDDRRTDADVLRAANVVGADRLIHKLSGGLRGELTEKGGNLSFGERQLVSLARALVHDPDLLLLDEATSAIDPLTEAYVQSSIERLLEGRTAVIVAHRLSTIRNCDEILVVNHGEIVERGTHDQLWAAGGMYRSLAALQFPELHAADGGVDVRARARSGAGAAVAAADLPRSSRATDVIGKGATDGR
jgi:ATP-binding cassette subfamily B protein